MSAGKRLPSQIFAVRVRAKGNDVGRNTEVYIYRVESAAKKHMENAKRYMYHDETAELLGTQLTWTPLADVTGELERD